MAGLLKTISLSSLILLAVFSLQGVLEAASVTERLEIRATVPPVLDYRITYDTAELKITGDDANKGYKDVPDGTVLTVTTNDLNGYSIHISAESLFYAPRGQPPSPVYSSVIITIGRNSYTVPAGGSIDVHMPYNGTSPETVKISYRFILPRRAHSGKYSWPIGINVSPI